MGMLGFPEKCLYLLGGAAMPVTAERSQCTGNDFVWRGASRSNRPGCES
jgi:hypothetical protein